MEKHFKFIAPALLLLACLLPGRIRAVPPTSSATPTCTQTSTPTPLAGLGSYTLAPPRVVTGDSGNWQTLRLVTGPVAYPPSGAVVSIDFPMGFQAPDSGNFFLSQPQRSQYQAGPAAYNPGPPGNYSVTLVNVPPNTALNFQYGFAQGFSVTAAVSSVTFTVSTSVGQNVLMPLYRQPTVLVVLPSPTATPSRTGTISPTFSVTPTITSTFTVTMTFTITPIGPVEVDKAYTYPNPFDLRKFDKVTLRFPPDTGVAIEIFNLVGEPVARLKGDKVEMAAGWAVWDGRDDHHNQVAGGIYFYRIRGDNRKWMGRFTVIH